MLATMVSCNSAEKNESKSNTANEETSENQDGAESQETKEQETEKKQDAELIGYCTEDSLYDGAFNSKVGWKAAGMGYLIKTGEGSLIAIDGGNTADAQGFYKLLTANYGKEGKITLDYWILTHPHGDHINALLSIANDTEISSKIEVKNLVYYFPDGYTADNISGYIADTKAAASKLGAKIVFPRKGRGIMLDNVVIDFLYVPTDYEQLNNINQLSLIFTVTANKKVMITGDAFVNSLIKVADQYGSNLKSDIIQMPHHFLCDTGYKAFYDFVNADCLLLPTCISGYEAMTNEGSEYKNDAEFKLHKNMLEEAKEVYKSFEGHFKIKI